METPLYLPGTASLIDYVDKRLMVVLRDGRKLIANLLLQDTVERIYVDHQFGDMDRGLHLLRGDTIALVAELEETEEQENDRAPIEEILVASHQRLEEEKQAKRLKYEAMRARGLALSEAVDPGDAY